MSVWTTKSSVIERNYIVLQHTLRGVNHTVNGIKFREGYAVVEKDSKTYLSLKKIPVLRSSKEYPLTHLRKLPFITRTADIRTVYGQDVYIKFLEEEEKAQIAADKAVEDARELELKTKQELQQKLQEAKQANNETLVKELEATIPSVTLCAHKTLDGTYCKREMEKFSPSGYCIAHLLDDPRLPEFGLVAPRFMTKKEKRSYRDKVDATLRSAKAQGKF